MSELNAHEKKSYNKPEIVEIGRLNQFIRANGVSSNIDDLFIRNGVAYATFDPDPFPGSTP